MFIRTERLFLRPAWPEDQDDLFQALLEEDDKHRLSSMPLPTTREMVHDYLVLERDPRLPIFIMCLRGTSGAELVGAIGLVRSGNDVELRYWVVPHHRGKGFAGEAVDALLAQAPSLGHHRIVARHFPEADDVRRVYEAAGFRRTRPRPHRALDAGSDDSRIQYYVTDMAAAWRPGPALHDSTIN